MKASLIALFILFSITINAQIVKVVSITPTSWTERTSTTVTHNNKRTGAVTGGIIGGLWKKSFWGVVGGGLLGSQLGDNPYTTTETVWTDRQIQGYIVVLDNKTSFRTTSIYIPNQLINLKIVKIE